MSLTLALWLGALAALALVLFYVGRWMWWTFLVVTAAAFISLVMRRPSDPADTESVDAKRE